jgi:hypothetical protein
MALQKYFSCPSVVNYFFQTPPKKLKLGLQVGGRFLIANHLVQSERGRSSQIIFITLFSGKELCFVVAFITFSKLCKNIGPK